MSACSGLSHGRRIGIGTERGFTLLEVLIAVLVLSIGLLGLAGLYAIGLRSVDSANTRTQASILAEDMLERMRANRDAAIAGGYNIGDLDAIAGGTSVAQTDLAEWKWRLGLVLQDPAASIACQASGVCTVTLAFDDTRGAIGAPPEPAEGDEPSPPAPFAFTFSTRL